jgi:hypothetical protein
MKPVHLLLAAILGVSLLLTGCGSSGPGPDAWLDRPLNQTHYPLEPLEIMAHASSAQGVTGFNFSVDGEVIHQAAVSGGRMEKATHIWTPPEPGVYLVGAAATDSSGTIGNLATSVVYIGGAGEDNPPDLVGVCQGVENIELNATPPSIFPGECSLLFWEVLAPPEWPVLVQGEAVGHAGEMPICLQESTAVELSVETEAGTCKTWQFIEVDQDLLVEAGPQPELNILFDANPPEILRGECSSLVWEVLPPEGGETLLQGQPVPAAGEQQVCPLETSSYELIAVRNQIGQSIFLTLHVLEDSQPVEEIPEITLTQEIGITLTSPPAGQPAPTSKPASGPTNTPAAPGPTNTPSAPAPTSAPAPDTSPPTIKSASVSPNGFVYTSDGSCTPTAFNFSVKVTDSGGIANVVLNWSGSGVRSGPLNMNYSGGKYVRTLGQFNNPGRLSGFKITATDKAGNTSSISPSWNLDVEQCGGGS